jgi:hypothetical protein
MTLDSLKPKSTIEICLDQEQAENDFYKRVQLDTRLKNDPTLKGRQFNLKAGTLLAQTVPVEMHGGAAKYFRVTEDTMFTFKWGEYKKAFIVAPDDQVYWCPSLDFMEAVDYPPFREARGQQFAEMTGVSYGEDPVVDELLVADLRNALSRTKDELSADPDLQEG